MTRLTADKRDRLSRTACRFCDHVAATPGLRREHEATCYLAYGDPED